MSNLALGPWGVPKGQTPGLHVVLAGVTMATSLEPVLPPSVRTWHLLQEAPSLLCAALY